MKRVALALVFGTVLTGCGKDSTSSVSPTPAATTLAVTVAASSASGISPPASLASMSVGFDSGSAMKLVAFPPRNEPFAFRLQLETVYQTQLRRGPTSTFVDIEGTIVWTQEYLRYRLSGCGHVLAVQYVLAEIDGAQGAPECGADVPFPPRNEPFDFRASSLEAKYRDGLRRQPVQTFVDIEGDIVWTIEYLRYRVAGCTHALATQLVLAQVTGAPPSAGCAAGDRTSVDRPDEVPGYQVKFMYVLPSDGNDRQLETSGTLDISVAAFQEWLARETGGQRLRTDTFGNTLDIAFVRLSESDGQIAGSGPFVRDRVQAALQARGFNDQRKIYGVYYDGSSTVSCGGGAWPPTLIGNVAALYLQGTPPGAPPCATNRFATTAVQPGYLEYSMLHEIMHTVGVVPSCAPHHTLAGHVSDDPTDLMYAGPLGWRPSRLDVGRDDYFRHARAGCLDVVSSVFLTPTLPGATPPPGWP